tara:strand:+ start:1053 stop:1673 length:621 start_codon:yes stop_codon:yes gene_type:complete
MYDFSMDMGLESSVTDQQSVQSGLDPDGSTTDTITTQDVIDATPVQPGFVSNYMKDLLKTNLVRDVFRDKFGKITGLTSVQNPFSPMSMFSQFTGKGPSSGIMGLLGGLVTPPGFGVVPSAISAITGQPTTTYTGYNPEDMEATKGGGTVGETKIGDNFTQSSLTGATDIYGVPDAQGIKGITGAVDRENMTDVLASYLTSMENMP